MDTAYEIRTPNQPSNIVIICDHATNIVPDWVNGGTLGLSDADMNRHIAYDIGALGVSQHLAARLDAHLVSSRFSRLVIDPNRGIDDPTSIMKIYDHTIIAANRNISALERAERVERLHRPYHEAIARTLDTARQTGDPIIISIHSFTPRLNGRANRPWHIGILSADDRRMADHLIPAFDAIDGVCVGDNEPYRGSLKGDTLDQHGLHNGTQHGLIEIRNDLISDADGQKTWADICYAPIVTALEKEGLI